MMNDVELTDEDKAYGLIEMLYIDDVKREDLEEALKQALWFINGGKIEESQKKSPKLLDWEQDYQFIVQAVNKTLGYESRAIPFNPNDSTSGVHWWTWLGGFNEIGDCMFSQIVNIRNKKARGKKLNEAEQEFYKNSKELIDLRQKFSQAEEETLDAWLTKSSKE